MSITTQQTSAHVRASRFGAMGLLAVALGCAAIAAVIVRDMLKKEYSGIEIKPIVVAKAPLSAGMPMRTESFVLRNWPKNSIPEGAFFSVETLMRGFGKSTPSVGILAGEPIVESRLASPNSGTGIAALVRPNMRAYAIETGESIGNTGLLFPGALIDIIATVRDEKERIYTSRTALQGVRVLSVGRDIDVATRAGNSKGKKGKKSSSAKKTHITLEVTPQQAEELAVVVRAGKIDLVLRNSGDDEKVNTEGATPASVSAPPAGTEKDATDKEAKPNPEPKKKRPGKRNRGKRNKSTKEPSSIPIF